MTSFCSKTVSAIETSEIVLSNNLNAAPLNISDYRNALEDFLTGYDDFIVAKDEPKGWLIWTIT